VKTKIITLESHDDLISVRDRMSWAKTPRILLVVPKFEKVVLRLVDLKILQRHARALGAQVGLVTRVRSLRADAEELGVPVFESTAQAQRASWAEPPLPRFPRRAPAENLREKREQAQVREEAWRAHPATRILAFLTGVMGVLAIVALFVPRAQVRLKPVTQSQSIVLPVIADLDSESISITGNIPAREKRILLDGTQTVIVTGETVIPQARATGAVEFSNLTQDEVTIPSGTIVFAGEIQFETTEEVIVPAGVRKKIEAQVQALDGGLAGNVDAETINALEGRLGLSVAVTNPEPISGGRELASVQASDADRLRARDLLLEFFTDEAQLKFLNEIESGDVLFEETITLSQILLEEYDPPAGAAGSTLTLTMQVEFTARYASASDVSELASLALNASLPSGFHAASAAVMIESAGTPVLDENGSARWQIRAERQITQSVDAAQVAFLIRGLSVDQARSRLDDSFAWESKPEISMLPSWWRWIPLLPFRIEVVME
jgi:hypothetical protein